MLLEVARGLGELVDECVFVGGATTALYIDDLGAPSPTPSDDVDLVVEIASKAKYRQLESTLRKKGFKDPIGEEESPICRKLYKGIQVDVMPTDDKILGFSNPWHLKAMSQKVERLLPGGIRIFIFNSAYFLASKLAAYRDRGGSDPRLSQDMDDICAILDGCSSIENEILVAPNDVQEYIREEFKKLLETEDLFEEAAHGFIFQSGDPIKRANRIVKRARAIAFK